MCHRPLTLVFSVLILVATGLLFTVIPKGLFPRTTPGCCSGTTEAAQGTSFAEMVRLQTVAMKALARTRTSPATCRSWGTRIRRD